LMQEVGSVLFFSERCSMSLNTSPFGAAEHLYQGCQGLGPQSAQKRLKFGPLNNKNKQCKEKNTFILSDSETVKSICNNRPDGDVRSKSQFGIIDCELISKTEKTPPCRYNGKHQFKKRIEVSCKGGYPVHYKSILLLHLESM
uniref:Ribonuclease A-domain domain-containing protein n=1 Tax=Haplochromis burtoni TaxID=8153 RepID=A0A3Q2W473_HAPBU